ncbi:MAG TPA: murein biosynthesis integral membrane protein MurJ, partial [Alcanivorax sp.]|nr:murein biosynthesis integral membrane protein MurJ [Alcanivorax sp.]
FAGIAMAAVTYWLSLQTQAWTEAGVWNRIGWLSLIVASGLAIYGTSLLVLGLRPRHLRR